jgi:hypothetical protein
LSIKNAPLSDITVFKEGISGEAHTTINVEEVYL